MEADIALIIPAYCEERRLPHYLPLLTAELAGAPFRTYLQIVDDGSPDQSHLSLRKSIQIGAQGNCHVAEPLRLLENLGKGGAILEGWTQASPARWLAFVDADGAIPAASVRAFLTKTIGGGTSRCMIGTRLQDTQVKRNFLRNISGKIFRQLTAWILHRKPQDTQCGLKAIPTAVFSKIQGMITEKGFAFDVNLLLAAERAGLHVEEFPVAFRDIGGGRIHPVIDGFRMLCSVLRLRRANSHPDRL